LESQQRFLDVRLDGVLMRKLLESLPVLLQDLAELGTQRRIVRRQRAQRPTELPDDSAGSPAASAAASRRGRGFGSTSRHKRVPKDGGLRRCLLGTGHRRPNRGYVGLLVARLGVRSHWASEAKCRQHGNETSGLHKTLFNLRINPRTGAQYSWAEVPPPWSLNLLRAIGVSLSEGGLDCESS
jgi:hypothetical protein